MLTEVDYSSGDDFEGESSRDGGRKTCPSMALLVGAPGSGKTSALFAIASSLGYQVKLFYLLIELPYLYSQSVFVNITNRKPPARLSNFITWGVFLTLFGLPLI
jgi:hypothetical protein